MSLNESCSSSFHHEELDYESCNCKKINKLYKPEHGLQFKTALSCDPLRNPAKVSTIIWRIDFLLISWMLLVPMQLLGSKVNKEYGGISPVHNRET